MPKTITVGHQPSLYTNLVAYDTYKQELGVPFFSAFGFTSHMDAICKDLNLRSKDICFERRYYSTNPGKLYETTTSRVSGSDYSHIIAFKKDRIDKDERTGAEVMTGYIFWESNTGSKLTRADLEDALKNHTVPQELIDGFYDKLYKLSPLPVIKEWSYYLIEEMLSYQLLYPLTVYSSDNSMHFNAYCFRIATQQLRSLISTGLSSHRIVVSETSNGVSDTMRDVVGLDAYLNDFRDTLARRIQDSFVPRFIPEKDDYSQELKDLAEYDSYMGRLDLFDAQKGVIQAASNALDHKKTAFIIGEPGSGKTAMATVAVLTHNANKHVMNNIVMCPGHLVEKWKKEIERLAPNSEAIIVPDFDSLLSLIPKIKDKKRRKHLWMVISKETAKFGYQERPVAVWSRDKGRRYDYSDGVYCCPECGKPLYTISYEGRGRYRREVRHYFHAGAFDHKTNTNAACMNTKRVWDKEKGEYKEVPCGAKLWSATGRYEKAFDIKNAPEESNWVNLGAKVGWIERDKIEPEFNRIVNAEHSKREDTAKLPVLSSAMEGDIPPQRAPIKYPLGKFIRRYLKGYIDYSLIDECHELKARDSLQGQAFGDLVKVAKHSLCFTGTLLNGYASGIFYILYRTFPGMMKAEGFEFSAAGEQEFTRQYGVYRTTSWYEFRNGQQGNHQGASQTKALPGVSPIVFTKFLLENAVFISLDDIGTGLPGYEEIPVPIDMDPELNGAYVSLENAIHDSFGARGSNGHSRGSMKTLAQMIQTLTIYPDQPFDQPPVIHPDTGDVVIEPPQLSKDRQRNKEAEFLRLVNEKVQEDQKVLVYYNWTNRTNLGKKLPEMLKGVGIKAVTMTASVNNRDRESWIQTQLDKGIDVLICNPSLVETGLDLLDFTTIIYYQVGYNLFTLRQASRRSWRLSQTKDVKVYFLYYRHTVQEQALSLMATKLQAAMAIEGKFSEEGLNAMSNNEDILTQIAASVADGIKDTVDAQVFSKGKVENSQIKKEDKPRMIDVPRERCTTSLLKSLDERRAKSRKRVVAAKACGVAELNLMNNWKQLFASL